MTVPLPPSVKEIAHDATTLAGPLGMTSYVLPSAGDEGGQPGWDNSRLANRRASRIVVDPHLEGQRIMITPSALTKEAVARAVSKSDIRKPGTSAEERNERSFQAVLELAGNAVPVGPVQVHAVPPQPMAPPLGVPLQPPPVPPPATPVPAATDGYASPNNVMTQPASSPNYNVPSMLPPVPQSLFARHPLANKEPAKPAAPDAASLAPSIEVVYEVEGSPLPMSAYFHAVELSGSTLVLIFDKRALGYPCNFPMTVSGQRVAIQMKSNGQVYYCNSPKHRFSFGSHEFCVLEINTEVANG